MKALVVCKGVWTVLAVCTERGDCELLNFLNGLGGDLLKQGDRMLALLNRKVAQSGPPRNTDVSHKLDGDIWELIQGDLRVLYFYENGRVIVCSHGLVKKRQKTPPADIEYAQRQCEAFRRASAAGILEIL